MLNSIKEGLTLLSTVDWSGVSVLFLIIVLAILLVKINTSESSTFFYDDLFLDESGKASTSKLANLVALILSSWAFIHLTLNGTLTETFFTTYMLAWVANRGVSQWLTIKQMNVDKNKISVDSE